MSTSPDEQVSVAPPAPVSRSRGPWGFVRETVIVVLAALLISLTVKTFIAQVFYIPSASMEPTLHGCTGCSADRVIAEKADLRFRGVKRGDIVVFRDTQGWLEGSSLTTTAPNAVGRALELVGLAPATSDQYLVKRVIGIGGDKVVGKGGKVYVNGVALADTYVMPGDSPSSTDFSVTVPAGRLWVMGDHRDDSEDSRAHQQGTGKGFVPQADVVGRVVAIVWPFDRARTI